MSSADAVRFIPDCKVSVDGAELKPADRAALTRAVIDLDVDLFAECTLLFNDPDLRLIGGNLFEAGKSVRVALGFGAKKTRSSRARWWRWSRNSGATCPPPSG